MLKGPLRYLFPREHTSILQSIKITLAVTLIGGFAGIAGDVLLDALQESGLLAAPESATSEWLRFLLRLVTAGPLLMCMFSSGFAFAQRAGVINVPELELQVALMREYLKDILRIGRSPDQK